MIEQMTWECVLVSSRRLPPLHRRYKARSKVVVNGGKIEVWGKWKDLALFVASDVFSVCRNRRLWCRTVLKSWTPWERRG